MSEQEMAKFRFQDLKIWQLAIQNADELFDIADDLKKIELYRLAEQLRVAGMSMSNNIAEGSRSSSKKEFIQFLNIARRSTFENANILMLLRMRDLISEETLEKFLDDLDELCRQITNFQNTLKYSPGLLRSAPGALRFTGRSALSTTRLPSSLCTLPYALCSLR